MRLTISTQKSVEQPILRQHWNPLTLISYAMHLVSWLAHEDGGQRTETKRRVTDDQFREALPLYLPFSALLGPSSVF